MFTKLYLFLALASLAGNSWAAEPFRSATMDQVETWISAKGAVVYDVNDDEVVDAEIVDES